MNRRNFISMLGLSALVAKVWPGVVKAKQPITHHWSFETNRIFHVSKEGMSNLILVKRAFPEWGNVIAEYRWNGECYLRTDNKQQRILCTKS